MAQREHCCELQPACSVWPTLLSSLSGFLFLFLLLQLFAPFSTILFHVAQGTNKGNKSREGLPPDTTTDSYLSISSCPSELSRPARLLHISLSMPWLANHVFCLSSSWDNLTIYFFFFCNESYIKFGATAENLLRVSPTREAIIKLYVIERTNIVLLRWFQHEVIVSDLWSAFNKIMPRFRWQTGVQQGGQVMAEARDILFSFCSDISCLHAKNLSDWWCEDLLTVTFSQFIVTGVMTTTLSYQWKQKPTIESQVGECASVCLSSLLIITETKYIAVIPILLRSSCLCVDVFCSLMWAGLIG